MSSPADGIFDKMVTEATENVARKGWKNATQKELTLAAFGMLNRQIKCYMDSFRKPFYWATGVITAGVLSYIIGNLLS